ncbi:MAG TPA: inorganic diphosphatase [Blastocatellia bacterium]|nr:inorganic diphosphatase [Blastocatellia bacterium]
MRYIDIPIGPLAPEVFNMVVEIPRNSANKYEYDPELNLFRLDRTLYSPMHYPGDYGFVPGTFAGDGDPLDVLVLVSNPSFTGCVLEVRPLGMLAMSDQGYEDLKVLCVPTRDPRSDTLSDYKDVLPHTLREIERFFSIYKELEGKATVMGGWKSAAEAKEAVIVASNRYKESAPKS